MDDDDDGTPTDTNNPTNNNKTIGLLVVIGLIVAGFALSNRKNDELDKIGDKASRCTAASIRSNTTSSECRDE